jgi:hypothetical protein
MNTEMAYLLGLVCGNGEVKRSNTTTTISISVPHKKLKTENNDDVRVYVKASITDLRAVLEPLIGTGIDFIQQPNYSVLSLTKPNEDFLIREILRHVSNASSHEDMRISSDVFNASLAERIYFLRGFSDVTGYIRKSNYHFKKHMHRVYIEVPRNWELVVDVCNLLKSVDVPVQNINWGHPNMRDGNLIDYDKGKPNSWKKEHQIKIWANEFEKIGFAVIHKKQALEKLSRELQEGINASGKDVESVTHKFYWEGKTKTKSSSRKSHPSANDNSIPETIRGQNFDSWKKIAAKLGYGEADYERV